MHPVKRKKNKEKKYAVKNLEISSHPIKKIFILDIAEVQ